MSVVYGNQKYFTYNMSAKAIVGVNCEEARKTQDHLKVADRLSFHMTGEKASITGA